MMETLVMRLILASSSPRRQKLLNEMGYEFEIVTPISDEMMMAGESPEKHVLRISRDKAESVAGDFADDLVLGADTIVVLNDRIFGKPGSKVEAVEMLETLSGKTHTVYTGLTIVNHSAGTVLSRYDSTLVSFNILNEYDIERYIDSGEPMDKAGAYGIQGMGSFLVERYDGELDTVIGFPRKLFKSMYEEVAFCQ
ncbi:MAG: nucleoside triphosphate pyrophosphatase [candidate division Zixibacteria bacterium]